MLLLLARVNEIPRTLNHRFPNKVGLANFSCSIVGGKNCSLNNENPINFGMFVPDSNCLFLGGFLPTDLLLSLLGEIPKFHGVRWTSKKTPQVSRKEQFQPMLTESADPILELEIKKFIVLWLRKGMVCFLDFGVAKGLRV